jgi:hypothetical protein
VRTPLHRIVQVLKRHRDVLFADDYDDKPPSSLITTLAARAYTGQSDLITGALAVVQRMPAFIENRDGTYWVMNPVCPDENFADKWNDYPLRRLKFQHWLGQVEQDLDGLLLEHGGITVVHERLQKTFGTAPVARAISRIGQEARQARESGSVLITPAGTLSASSGRPMRDHRFFGGPSDS